MEQVRKPCWPSEKSLLSQERKIEFLNHLTHTQKDNRSSRVRVYYPKVDALFRIGTVAAHIVVLLRRHIIFKLCSRIQQTRLLDGATQWCFGIPFTSFLIHAAIGGNVGMKERSYMLSPERTR
mmetsp:Transcript_12037/g.21876  ORF Transcript_12037/g.21876 Transcript_12037/m.21876 type:complete len:123 (+) Transcript_12037:1628-1996(+)